MSMSIGNIYSLPIEGSGIKISNLPLLDIPLTNGGETSMKKRSMMFNNEAALRLRNILRRNTEYPIMKVNSNNVPIPQASFYGGMPLIF